MATRYGWTKGPLSMERIREMSSGELRFHEVCNAEEFNAALQREANRKHNREQMPYWNAKRMYAGHATEDESAEAEATANRFAERTPQLVRNLKNAMAIYAYLESHNLDARRIESYAEAFRVLSDEGKLELAQPESADAYYASHQELHDKRIPPIIEARCQRNTNTEAHFANTASATTVGNVVRVIDYGKQTPGVPPQSDKVSFRKRIESMSADEIRKECEMDPAFKAALDSLVDAAASVLH